jgi:small subunit ribosomal protein S9
MATDKTTTYYEAVGRRKTAVARVRITETTKQTITVNDKPLEEYFPVQELQALVRAPFEKAPDTANFSVEAHLKGGGIASQAEALRLGISRALIIYNETFRGALKEAGYLRRNPRVKERKKFGLRKARRAPQWSKR